MPLYEFYCGTCNALFNFFSSHINTRRAVPSKCFLLYPRHILQQGIGQGLIVHQQRDLMVIAQG